MGVQKLAIITCSNATSDLDCCSICCLSDLAKRKGTFKQYSEEDTLRLVGLVSCSGCPTLAYPEKILRKIDSLVEFGVTHLHFSYCMTSLCPFIKKYAEVISRTYPQLKLIEGTHEEHLTHQQFREKVKEAFAHNKNMADIILGKI